MIKPYEAFMPQSFLRPNAVWNIKTRTRLFVPEASDFLHVSAQQNSYMHNILHGTMYQTFNKYLLIKTRTCTMFSHGQCVRVSPCVCSTKLVHVQCSPWSIYKTFPMFLHMRTRDQKLIHACMHNVLHGTMYQTFSKTYYQLIRTLRTNTMFSMVYFYFRSLMVQWLRRVSGLI